MNPKILISESGFLSLGRKGGIKQMHCVNAGNRPRMCGDHCPLFGEPEEYDIVKRATISVEHGEFVGIEICENRLLTCRKSEFVDSRG